MSVVDGTAWYRDGREDVVMAVVCVRLDGFRDDEVVISGRLL